MSKPVQVRQFRFPEDYQQVYDLWSSIEKGVHIGRSDTLEEIEKKVSRDPDLFLVAECGGIIVGSVIGGFDGRRGLIYHLAVHKSFRKMGIGTQLMAEVESGLRTKGCRKSYLLVAEDNQEAEMYYQRRGWEQMNTIHLFGKDM